MSGAVRAPVLGEQVPLFVTIGLAIIGILSALLTASALADRASKIGARASVQERAEQATLAPQVPEVDGVKPAKALDGKPGASASDAVIKKVPDCPQFPGFSFRVGRSKPIDNLDAGVAALVEWMQGHPNAVLIIEGHADATGGPKRNLGLSFDRAGEVAELFTSQGLDRQRIDVEAYGAFRPLGRREGPSADDRRVSLRTGGEPVCSHREGNTP